MPEAGLVVWVEAAPVATIDGDGVKIVYRSGEVEFTTRMSRANFRKQLEFGMRILNAWERETNVSPFCQPCFRVAS